MYLFSRFVSAFLCPALLSFDLSYFSCLQTPPHTRFSYYFQGASSCTFPKKSIAHVDLLPLHFCFDFFSFRALLSLFPSPD